MLEIVQYKTEKADKLLDALEGRQQKLSPRVDQQVRIIIKAVQKDGDKAVLKYTKEFDDVIHNAKSMKLTKEKIKQIASKVKPEMKKVIKRAIVNVTEYHKKQKISNISMKTKDGVLMGQKVSSINRVGLYVPGGSGAYPSSVIMNVVPARIAGVKEIVIVTPPLKNGITADVAAVLSELDIEEVYLIGGAQAIAALTYGTETIKKVDKIVGPGNLFVSAAKKMAFGDVDIDTIAGPSEVVIVADDTTNPAWIAADMLAQAEHGSGYEMSVCVSTSPRTAIALHREIISQMSNSPRKSLIEKSFSFGGGLFVVKNDKEAAELVDRLAPEHLQIMTKQPEKIRKMVNNAGAIFLGQWTPVATGDYLAGPSHVLPTGGTARFFSPVGVYDFIKRSSFIQYTESALKKHAKDIMLFSNAEGFFHHGDSVRRRVSKK